MEAEFSPPLARLLPVGRSGAEVVADAVESGAGGRVAGAERAVGAGLLAH